MEDVDKLNVGDVSSRPKETAVDDCEVTAVRRGTREDFYPETEEADLEYGSMDDEMVQIEVEVDHEGETIPVTDDMRFYENLTDRTHLGRYVQKYGAPEKGQSVTVEFDEEGNGSIVY